MDSEETDIKRIKRGGLASPKRGGPASPSKHTPKHKICMGEDGEEVFCFDTAVPPAPPKDPIPNYVKVKLGDVIGKGSHGTVYLGRRDDTGQIIAVKETAVDDAAAMKAMEAEVKVLGRLRHPNCIEYLGSRKHNKKQSESVFGNSFGEEEDEDEATHIHVFLDLVSGGTLSDLVSTFGPVRELFLLQQLTCQCTRGLQYLHMKGTYTFVF